MRAAAAQTDEDAEAYADFEQRIIIDRNHTMAERAAPILAGGNVFRDPLGNLFPACRLPCLERAFIPTESPANRKVHIACVVRNRF